LPPEHFQRQLTNEDRRNRLLQVIGAQHGGSAGNRVPLRQDASVYVSALEAGVVVNHEFMTGRRLPLSDIWSMGRCAWPGRGGADLLGDAAKAMNASLRPA
jgi:hypothetical protein